MPIAKFEFQVKRGVVDIDSDEDSSELIKKCIALCKKNDHQGAVDLIMPSLNFEWIWSNCDGEPSEITSEAEDLSFQCTHENSVVKLGADDGDLVITATVFFEIDVKKGWSKEKLSDWLSDNSAYACGYVGGGWSYAGSDGDNVWVTDLRGN
jgi:hypothetical protein